LRHDGGIVSGGERVGGRRRRRRRWKNRIQRAN